MIYLFDTSAINQLHDDPERDPITKGLISTNTVYITALNVAEALATKDTDRRQSLIQLEKVMAKGDNPIVTPQELLHIQCHAQFIGASRPCMPLFTQDPLILKTYNVLSPTEESTRDLILPWKTEVESSYDRLYIGSRPNFQTLFTTDKVKRPPSFARLIRDHYGADDDFIYEYASSVYQGACGAKFESGELRRLLTDIPELLLILLSYAYSVFARSIKEERYNPKWNAGAVDLWSSIYLPHSDYFISHDKQQRRALREMNIYNPRKTEILSYESFRARLLLE
ncbi:MAG: hypothetical protein MOB07_30665 [Acidobacteria bacterium]|nr:hypothetical protein [Acidobacteriota bacterium]